MRKFKIRKKFQALFAALILLCFCCSAYGDGATGTSDKYDPIMYREGLLRNPCIDYDFVGVIYEINKDSKTMVIDDIFFKFSSKITFHSYSSMNISIHNLKAGKKVAYILNENHELASVCILKK